MPLSFPQIKHWFPIVHMRIAFAANGYWNKLYHIIGQLSAWAAIETKIELRWWWHCLAHWLQTADNWGKAQLFVIDISDSFISIRCCWWNPTSHTSHQFRYSVLKCVSYYINWCRILSITCIAWLLFHIVTPPLGGGAVHRVYYTTSQRWCIVYPKKNSSNSSSW